MCLDIHGTHQQKLNSVKEFVKIKDWLQIFPHGDPSSRQKKDDSYFQKILRQKCALIFVLRNASSKGFCFKPTRRPSVPLKNGTKEFKTAHCLRDQHVFM